MPPSAPTNPDKNLELIQFAELHEAVWTGASTRIGLTSAQTAAYKSATAAARDAYTAVQAGKLQQKALVQTQNQKVSELRNTNSALLRIIRGFAQDASDPIAVYNDAQIPPPAAPTPLGPPNAPTDLTADLALLDGGIEVKWKASQVTSGTVYRVERAIGAGSAWVLIGLTGGKSALDVTIPVGTSRVLYRVVAQRGSVQSTPSAVLDIRFGTGPGEMNVTALKMAA